MALGTTAVRVRVYVCVCVHGARAAASYAQWKKLPESPTPPPPPPPGPRLTSLHLSAPEATQPHASIFSSAKSRFLASRDFGTPAFGWRCGTPLSAGFQTRSTAATCDE
ncbi:hypothetical protein EYF80_021563 [Liparis tanakae]|uniref:Uncharacterized protein n=1 Tax=Liparis tanakae TaxID=230148 RepID=A0A4Z2HRP7_9TELE|nr:hypothetical protein EYF80_021563 [Liparis tanakae]